MSNYLSSIHWDILLTINFTADDIWNAFCNILNSAIEQFIPSEEISRYLGLPIVMQSYLQPSKPTCNYLAIFSHPERSVAMASKAIFVAIRTSEANCSYLQPPGAIHSNPKLFQVIAILNHFQPSDAIFSHQKPFVSNWSFTLPNLSIAIWSQLKLSAAPVINYPELYVAIQSYLAIQKYLQPFRLS